MRSSWRAGARGLGGAVATLALLAGVGFGLFRLDAALAGQGGSLLVEGVDPMPVGSLPPAAHRRP